MRDELDRYLTLYSANEIKHQGTLIGHPVGKYRAWQHEDKIVIINEQTNERVAILPVEGDPWPIFARLDEVGKMILVAAGVR
jgi:hypothetical protein